jgi:hypothetical protein
MAVLGSVALLVTTSSWMPALAQQPPSLCNVASCSETDANAKRLKAAWSSEKTTDAQRQYMRDAVGSHSVGQSTDWAAAAEEYFNWYRRSVGISHGYEATKAVAEDAASEMAARESIDAASRSAKLRAAKLRTLGEEALRSRLVDPNSADFSWPYEFTAGDWKAGLLSKRVHGTLTCGEVNARNRMGGYNGQVGFVVVFNSQDELLYADVGEVTGYLCDEAVLAHRFKASEPDPTPKPSVSPNTGSVADELERLVLLRERGAITPEEFEEAKAQALRR